MTDCKECKVNFSKISNLRAHVKRKHPDKLDTLAPKIKYSHRNHPCKECSANFVNFGNLRVHVKRKHPGKLDELAPVPVNNTDFECKRCKKKFQMVKNLILHNKVCTVNKEVKCPLCQFTNPTSTMINHYIEMHDLQIVFEALEFESFETFKEWKAQIERETFASFISLHGSRLVKNGARKIKYTCHRSGVMEKKGKNIRALKKQGSNKINAYCPAEMAVEICNEKCLVKFCKSHVGHSQDEDLGHLFLSTSDRQFIAAKIASKMPFPAILDDIRDSISSCHLKRLHLLTKKDLYNVKQAFNFNKSSVRHANDDISVEIPITITKELSGNPGNPINDLNDHTKESENLVSAFSTSRSTSCERDKVCEKQKHRQEILGTSMEELDAVERIMLRIKPTLEEIRNSTKSNISFIPSTSRVPDNKKIVPRIRLCKKKIYKKNGTQTFSILSAEETNLLAAHEVDAIYPINL